MNHRFRIFILGVKTSNCSWFLRESCSKISAKDLEVGFQYWKGVKGLQLQSLVFKLTLHIPINAFDGDPISIYCVLYPTFPMLKQIPKVALKAFIFVVLTITLWGRWGWELSEWPKVKEEATWPRKDLSLNLPGLESFWKQCCNPANQLYIHVLIYMSGLLKPGSAQIGLG